MLAVADVDRSRQPARRGLNEIAIRRDLAKFSGDIADQSALASGFVQIEVLRVVLVSLAQQQQGRVYTLEQPYGVFLEQFGHAVAAFDGEIDRFGVVAMELIRDLAPAERDDRSTENDDRIQQTIQHR